MSFNNNNSNDTSTKNMVIAMVAFIAIMFGYNYFFESNNNTPPTTEQKQDNTDKKNTTENIETDSENESEEDTAVSKEISLKDALSKDSRVSIENKHIKGSIDLNGGIIDNITLNDYKETVEKNSDNVMLLTPKGTNSEFYYTINYKDKTNNEIISDKTVWVPEDLQETAQSIKLKTQTQNGLIIERTITLDDGYMINIKDKVINVSDKELRLSKSSDLVRSNPKHNNYAVVHEGLVGNSSKKVEEIKYSNVEGKTNLTDCEWFGYTDIYWLCSIINKDKNSSVSYSKTDEDSYKISTHSKKDFKISKDSVVEFSYSLFTGPKDIRTLKNYEKELNIDKFDMAIDFGWFFMITKPLVQLMDILQKIFANMGLVILILTLLFKVLTYPLMKKSFSSAAKMKEVQPRVAALQKAYAHDKMRMNQEMMALYKREKVSPMSGCLPMLLQAPIFFCLYKVFFISIEMRHAPLFGWIHDLSAPDSLYIFNLFGLIDWTPPSFLQIGVWPLIMGLSMFIQQKLSSSNKSLEKTSEQKMQENMMLIMPVMFTYICSSFPVGVVIYWTISNLFSMGQQYHANKKFKKTK